jgi:hypothetical protein
MRLAERRVWAGDHVGWLKHRRRFEPEIIGEMRNVCPARVS